MIVTARSLAWPSHLRQHNRHARVDESLVKLGRGDRVRLEPLYAQPRRRRRRRRRHSFPRPLPLSPTIAATAHPRLPIQRRGRKLRRRRQLPMEQKVGKQPRARHGRAQRRRQRAARRRDRNEKSDRRAAPRAQPQKRPSGGGAIAIAIIAIVAIIPARRPRRQRRQRRVPIQIVVRCQGAQQSTRRRDASQRTQVQTSEDLLLRQAAIDETKASLSERASERASDRSTDFRLLPHLHDQPVVQRRQLSQVAQPRRTCRTAVALLLLQQRVAQRLHRDRHRSPTQ